MSDDLGPKIVGYVYGARVESTPSQVECSIVGTLHRNNDAEGLKLGYFQMIYRLMLAGFCLLLTCSPVFGQFTVTERSEFTVTVRNQDETPSANEDELYVLFLTSPSCGPCQAYKRAGHWDRVKARYPRSMMVDIATVPQWRNRRIPQFLLARVSDRGIVRQWTGATTIETIETAARSQDMAKDSPASTDSHPVSVVRPFRNPSLFGSVGTSHESRSTLIRHLLNDGIHRGRWQIDTLNAMSDDALNEAHSDDHRSGR